MFDQRFAGGTIASHDVNDAGRDSDLLADFGERKRRQRCELSWFQHDGVSHGQSGSDLPGQHEQRKVPWDDLSHNPASRIARKLLRQKLRPTSVIIKMPGYQWDIDVAALANWFSVVDGFEHGETA